MNRYVTLLCARQVLRRVRRRFQEFAHERRGDFEALETRLESIARLRTVLEVPGGDHASEMFLEWFERMFDWEGPAPSEETGA